MKKLLTLLLIATIALSLTMTLAACGGDGGGNGQGSGNSGGNNQGGSTTPTPSLPSVAPILPIIDENPVSDFEYEAVSGGVEITKYIGASIRVRIPGKIEGISVTSIGDKAFFQTGIMEIIIPDTVTNIGRSAFSGNEALTNVIMGNSTISTGNLIHFGGIFWRVLDVQDGKAFIISEDILETRPYHSPGGDITWEHSTLRAYLNSEFLSSFSQADQARISETTVINKKNPTYDTPGGNNTVDKIFLLSIDEARTYFANDSARIAYDSDGEAVWWWLRSPDHAGYAADVDINGSIYSGYNFVDYNGGVRPALWLNLQ